jgi:hypothetical protein
VGSSSPGYHRLPWRCVPDVPSWRPPSDAVRPSPALDRGSRSTAGDFGSLTQWALRLITRLAVHIDQDTRVVQPVRRGPFAITRQCDWQGEQFGIYRRCLCVAWHNASLMPDWSGGTRFGPAPRINSLAADVDRTAAGAPSRDGRTGSNPALLGSDDNFAVSCARRNQYLTARLAR